MRLSHLGRRLRACMPALRTLRRVAPRCLLGVLTGCRSAATPYSSEPGTAPARATVLARQVLEDSFREFGTRPLKTSWHFVTETSEHLGALAAGEFGKRVLVPLSGTPGPLTPSNETLDVAGLEDDLQQLTGEELQPAEVRMQVSGEESLAALEACIARATTSIDVIMFQWENDALGQRIAARLAAAAGPNLRVRILIDGGGNLFFSEPEDADAEEVNRVVHNLAQHPYIEVVRTRNPFARYDHRKLVIVDGRLAWTGGRNFSRDAFFKHHDLTFVIEGPLAVQLQRLFDADWEEQGGSTPPSGTVRGQQGEGTQPQQHAETPVAANSQARLLHSEPCDRQLAAAIYDAVDRARHHIYVENVYLTDSRLVVRLCEARRRGVDVRVVMTVKSTTPTINQSSRAVANRLLAAGVRVYLFPGMTHVKALAVDGLWAYLGTGNLDPQSLRHNHELGFALSGGALVTDLEQRLFLEDMRPQNELTRPLPLSFHDWLCEWVASICL